jgi:hypothetical protein
MFKLYISIIFILYTTCVAFGACHPKETILERVELLRKTTSNAKIEIVEEKFLKQFGIIEPNRAIFNDTANNPNVYMPEVNDSGRAFIKTGDEK